MLVFLRLGEHYTVSIPMQFQVRYRRTVCWSMDRAYTDIATQVGQLHYICLKSTTRCRGLVAPVIGLCAQRRAHCATCRCAQFITGRHHPIRIQERIAQKNCTLVRQRLLGIFYSLFIPKIHSIKAFLRQLKQFIEQRFIFGHIISWLFFHISKSQLYRFNVQPFQIFLNIQNSANRGIQPNGVAQTLFCRCTRQVL